MVQLAHEVWHCPDSNSFDFCRPNKRADAFRAENDPNAKLVHVIHASSWDEAMIQYHQWQGWKAYTPLPGNSTRPYAPELLVAQKACRPEL